MSRTPRRLLVRATKVGYFEHVRKEPGDEFELVDRPGFEIERQFSPAWMEEVADPALDDIDIGREEQPDLNSIVVHETPNFSWHYDLQPGDAWRPHPAGGVLVVNPQRKPLWIHVADDGKSLVQETLEI